MIIIQTLAESTEHDPVRRACTLLGECVIEEGVSADYKRLAPYHYRQTSYPPAVHQVYRARYIPNGETVGVIVYAAPALNLGIRNKIFGDRFKIGGGRGVNDLRAARLNAELELIIRVVVHPTFRGTGLGARLIRETLRQRPYRFVEMSAAMGNLNPFAERAGMKGIKVPRPENTERVLSALRSVGFTDATIGNPTELVRSVQALPGQRRTFVEREMIKYATSWIRSRSNRDYKMDLPIAAARVASNALITTMYYIFDAQSAAQP